MAGGVQMGPCQVIAGSQCAFLLADGASLLNSLNEVQEPIDVKWAFYLLFPFCEQMVDLRVEEEEKTVDFRGWVDVLTAVFF
jgi:hypothetical protein